MPINAADIMTRRVVTARPDGTVAEVAKLLSDHDISAIPVCADDGTLLGMINESDLMRPFWQAHSLHHDWWLGVLCFGSDVAQSLADYIDHDRHRIRDLMTCPVITASETTTPGEIADLLLRHHIKRLPIVRDGKLVGIVSRADLICALALRHDAFDHLEWQPNRCGSDNPTTVSRGAG